METKLPIEINVDRRFFDCCVRCGICLGSCPAYKIIRQEAYSPRGRLEIMRAIANKKPFSADEIKPYLSSCLFCLRCQNNCPAGVEFDLSFFLCMGLLMKRRDVMFKDIAYSRVENEEKVPSFSKVEYWAGAQIKGDDQGQARALIFPGCFISLNEMEHIKTYLIKKGVNTLLPPERVCCGLPFLLKGEIESALRHIKQNIEVLNRLDIRAVFTPCPFCLMVFRRYYPIFSGSKIDIEFKHISDSLMYEDLMPAWEKDKKVAYHTSCLIDKATSYNHKKILKCLAGDSFIDIPGDICCGNGFGHSSEDSAGICKEICLRGLGKIAERGVKCLVTDCPSCTSRWREGIAEGGWDIEVLPFWHLVPGQK
ncbi:(Fe-S)-binding protein [bacterium]|nr:(Fe-S)-binding protein [bacterium]